MISNQGSSESDKDDVSTVDDAAEGNKKEKGPKKGPKRQRDASVALHRQATTPQKNDVLMGRGRPFQNSTGNRRMLSIVSEYKREYASQSREDKQAFVEIVLDKVLQGGCRFLKRKEGLPSLRVQEWEQVDRKVAAVKVWHILRAKDKNAAPDNSDNDGSNKNSSSCEAATAAQLNDSRSIQIDSRGGAGVQSLPGQQMPTSSIPTWFESLGPGRAAITGANRPTFFTRQASTASSQQFYQVREMEDIQQTQIDVESMQSLLRVLLNHASKSSRVHHPQQQESRNHVAPTNANVDASTGGQGESIALRILDTTLRDLIAKLSQASAVLQVSAAIAGLPIPYVQHGPSEESVQVALQVALAARPTTSSAEAPNRSHVNIDQILPWLQQYLLSLQSDLNDVANGNGKPRRDA